MEILRGCKVHILFFIYFWVAKSTKLFFFKMWSFKIIDFFFWGVGVGLTMIYQFYFTHALKSNWIRRLLLSKPKWINLLVTELKINDLWEKEFDLNTVKKGNTFW